MPLPKGTRYAMKKTSKGMVRLAFGPGNKVIEAKNMSSGATHTPSEFKKDRKGMGGGYAKMLKGLRRFGPFKGKV